LAARRGVSVLDSDLARAATQRERELLKASLPLPASSFVVCPQQGVSNCSPVLTAPIKAYEEKKTRIGRTREMPVGSLSVRSPPAEKVDLWPEADLEGLDEARCQLDGTRWGTHQHEQAGGLQNIAVSTGSSHQGRSWAKADARGAAIVVSVALLVLCVICVALKNHSAGYASSCPRARPTISTADCHISAVSTSLCTHECDTNKALNAPPTRECAQHAALLAGNSEERKHASRQSRQSPETQGLSLRFAQETGSQAGLFMRAHFWMRQPSPQMLQSGLRVRFVFFLVG